MSKEEPGMWPAAIFMLHGDVDRWEAAERLRQIFSEVWKSTYTAQLIMTKTKPKHYALKIIPSNSVPMSGRTVQLITSWLNGLIRKWRRGEEEKEEKEEIP